MMNINVTFRRSRARIATLGAALLLPAGALQAAPSATWIGGAPPAYDQNGPLNGWIDPGNWSSGIVPGDGTQDPEDVTIGQTTDFVRHGGTHTINSLSNLGHLDMMDGSELSINNTFSNDGLVTADNSFSTLGVMGDLNNNATGDITSHYVSSFGVTVGGDLNNAGHVGAWYGADQQNLLAIGVTGDIHNTGTIDSKYGGITALISSPTGSFENDGTFGSSFGGTTLIVTNAITNNNTMNAQFGSATVLSSQADMVNNGAISTAFGGEIDSATYGGFTNNGSVNAGSGTLISLSAAGPITNSVTSTVAAGQYAEVDLLSDNGVTNHGAISADHGGLVYIDPTNDVVTSDGSITTATDGDVVVTGDLIQTGGQTKINGYLDLGQGDGDGTMYLEGGTLGGGGEINGSVVQDGGTFAPGDPTTTHITGDYTQNAGVTTFVINSASDFDRIDIGGAYLYNGGTINFDFTSNFFNGPFFNHPYEFDFLHFSNFIGDPSAIHFTTNLRPADTFSFNLDSDTGTYNGTFVSSVVVPEPNSGVILLTLTSGLGLLLWTARRRKSLAA